ARSSGTPRVMMWPLAGLYSFNGAISTPGAKPHRANYPALAFSPLLVGKPAYDPRFAIVEDELPLLVALSSQNVTPGYYIGYGGGYHQRWNPRPRMGTCTGTALACVDNDDCVLATRPCNLPPAPTACSSINDLEEIEVLQPYSPCQIRADAHRAAQFAELDTIVALGGQEVGLDAIVEMPLWDSAPWIRELRSRYPALHFIGETSPSDAFILHSASFLYSNGNVSAPPVLADFLAPGHEDLAPLRDRPCGMSPTVACLRSFAESIAQLGYVVAPWDFNVDLTDDPSRYLARKSWVTTVPVDLRDPCAPPDLYVP
ncbi:MAG: hypothetical protein ABL886_16925, partial [Rhodoglobus sp.]